MKILLSGATGFVGRHLVKKLQEDGYDLTLLVRSKTTTRQSEVKKIHYYTYDNDAALLCSFMQQEKFDGVIHLASLFLAQHKDEDIKNLIESNVTLGTSLLEAATKSNVAWFINTGTFWQHYQNKKYSPVNLYAATKQAFEDIARYYLETTPINFVPFAV
jgi:nucleoside-diphosphate-sugar epimerase